MSKSTTSLFENILTNFFVNEYIWILWGLVLLILSSQISIPIEPVPITLQTFGVMLIALTFERKAAIKTIMTYLILGAVGAPVFANFAGGYSILIGPTGGYLIGFLISVAVMTTLRLQLKDQNTLHLAFNCLIGTFIILAVGIARLSQFIGWHGALYSGFVPFIIPGLIKALLLTLTLKFLRSIK